MYFNGLPKVDQRVFVSPGVRCTLDDERVEEGGDMSNVKLHVDWRLESPDVLEERLTIALSTNTRLPHPMRRDCEVACGTFVLWAVGRSSNWFNQPNRYYVCC